MSPLEIHCLLEYHTMPWGSPDIKNRHPMAVKSLLECGLIAVDDEALEDEPVHKITAKGAFYVGALQALPLPISSLSIPPNTEFRKKLDEAHGHPHVWFDENRYQQCPNCVPAHSGPAQGVRSQPEETT